MRILGSTMVMGLMVFVLTAILVVGANSVIPAQDSKDAEVTFYVH